MSKCSSGCKCNVESKREIPETLAKVFEKYPDLKGHKDILDAVANKLEASGNKGASREAFLELGKEHRLRCKALPRKITALLLQWHRRCRPLSTTNKWAHRCRAW